MLGVQNTCQNMSQTIRLSPCLARGRGVTLVAIFKTRSGADLEGIIKGRRHGSYGASQQRRIERQLRAALQTWRVLLRGVTDLEGGPVVRG